MYSKSSCRNLDNVTGYQYNTSTSPSIYLELPLVSASDRCGSIGPTLTSVTLGFAPEEVSTMDDYSQYKSKRPIDITYLPCGPPGRTPLLCYDLPISYQPYVALPPRLTELAPEWSRCQANNRVAQDPPRALSPARTMALAETNVDMNPKAPYVKPSPVGQRVPFKTADPATILDFP